MACAADAPAAEMVPGDSLRVTQVLAGDSLPAFAPGSYDVNVAVTVGSTGTYVAGLSAGSSCCR